MPNMYRCGSQMLWCINVIGDASHGHISTLLLLQIIAAQGKDPTRKHLFFFAGSVRPHDLHYS